MLKFIRVKGKVIPIIKDAIKKGSGVFGRSGKIKSHQERIDAIRSVRSALTGKGKILNVDGAETSRIFSFKNKIVKDMGASKFSHIDRLSIENYLYKNKLAPKTFLIQTKKKSYMVQDKVKKTAYRLYHDTVDKLKNPLNADKVGGAIQNEMDKTSIKAKKLLDLSPLDEHWGNFGFNGKKAKILDAGGVSFLSQIRKSGLGKKSIYTRNLNEYRAKLRSVNKLIKGKN